VNVFFKAVGAGERHARVIGNNCNFSSIVDILAIDLDQEHEFFLWEGWKSSGLVKVFVVWNGNTWAKAVDSMRFSSWG
jgi:hypothetical protein